MASPEELKYMQSSLLLDSEASRELKMSSRLAEVQNLTLEGAGVKFEVYQEKGYESEGENLSNEEEEFKECQGSLLATPTSTLSSDLKRVKGFPPQPSPALFVPSSIPLPPMCLVQGASEKIMPPPRVSFIPPPPASFLLSKSLVPKKKSEGKILSL